MLHCLLSENHCMPFGHFGNRMRPVAVGARPGPTFSGSAFIYVKDASDDETQ
jgi:hypothetical protein